MKNKRSSIKDIAAHLNVSVTTVSFVLNGKAKEKRISAQVEKKVLAYAKEINYTPNQLAKSLRTGKSNIIVLMVEDISNHFFSKIARIVEDLAYAKGYKVLFCSNENEDERSRALINLFRERQVDAYIIVPSPGIQPEITELIADNIPVVLFDRYFPEIETNYVIIDNFEAVNNACRHLIEYSYQNIGFISISSSQTQMQARQRAYREAMQANHLNEFVLEVPFYDVDEMQIKNKIHEYLLKQPLDALFFSTNYLTQIGLKVLREHFPEKLENIGIVAFDDHGFFEICSPSITAISQPLEEIGAELMATVFNMIHNKPLYKEQKKIASKLIVRDSTNKK